MRTNKGSVLIEIVIGSAIIALGILTISGTYTEYIKYALANQRNVESAYLLEEGLEVASFLRDESWSTNIATLSTTTTYYLSFSSSAWKATTTPQYVDGVFLRSFQVGDVKRDSNSDIANSGIYDSDIKKITVSVSFWQGHSTTTRIMSAYIANI